MSSVPLRSETLESVTQPKIVLKCLQPANKFCCCCPLRQGIFVISLICLVIGTGKILKLLSILFGPYLISAPHDPSDATNESIFSGALGDGIVFVSTLNNLLVAVLALIIGYFAWEGAANLNSKKTSLCSRALWYWIGLDCLSLIGTVLYVKTMNSELSPTNSDNPTFEGPNPFMLIAIIIAIKMTLSAIIYITIKILTIYYLDSFTILVESGSPLLVVLGADPSSSQHRQYPFNTEYSTIGYSTSNV